MNQLRALQLLAKGMLIFNTYMYINVTMYLIWIPPPKAFLCVQHSAVGVLLIWVSPGPRTSTVQCLLA